MPPCVTALKPCSAATNPVPFWRTPPILLFKKLQASSSLGERAGDWIGRYKLLEKFGERGAGWFMWQRRKTR